jgi:broad specificity phosphatase PhoE
MGLVYLVQHAEKQPEPGDPGLTDGGHLQAAHTGQWLADAGLVAVYSSPLRRASETASHVATACGLEVRTDARLRERMNFDGTQSMEEFLADWTRTVHDRDFVPRAGESSNQTAARMLTFIEDHLARSGAIAAVTHGGATVDLLRTWLDDEAVPGELVERGVPPCAVTTVGPDGVVQIARTDHLG